MAGVVVFATTGVGDWNRGRSLEYFIMITDVRTGINQTPQVQPAVRTSRIRALRILGGLQIGLGVVCGFLGIVGAILSNTEMNNRCEMYNYYNGHGSPLSGSVSSSSYHRCGQSTTILKMNLIGMGLSGWFILTGCVPLCMTDKRQSSWRRLVAFSTNTGSVITVSVFLAVFSFIEFIISIVAASHCCCCSQLNTGNQQQVIFMNIAQSGMNYNMPNTQIPTGNQQGYHQMWMPQMQGYYGQQPVNMPNNQQQAGHSQGNQMPILGYYGQQPQSFEMANQQQNINAQQF
ncbi:unnamed protein product [Mytilus coruscus]|uniref:Uncharacterized protein n=1 Tax=Mytilus coruscus TaxID=42192 RepID=A0A6J8C6V2_MYTCO|nr:unnamed protein product [Mytilus coruscus]